MRTRVLSLSTAALPGIGFQERGVEPDRVLVTVLFTDIVDSAKQAAEMGDRKWGELLQLHRVIVRRELARFRG
jgi:class 3 adenylate cyclase